MQLRQNNYYPAAASYQVCIFGGDLECSDFAQVESRGTLPKRPLKRFTHKNAAITFPA